jgi:uncharacterized MAPEG superfamily protein
MFHLVVPLMIAGGLPFLMTLVAKAGRLTREDNHHIRVWQGQLTGWRQRAHWAHQNAFETFPLFAAGAIVAHLAAPASLPGIALTWAFPALRVVYSVAYVTDQAQLRSGVWLVSLGVLLALFGVALFA